MGRLYSFSEIAQTVATRKTGSLSGITFDTGGLISLDRNERRTVALISSVIERGLRITIPASTLAQAMRSPAKQVRLSRLIRQSCTDLVALDGLGATAVGLLLAHSGTSDIVDAHVVVCARQSRQPVLTSDPDDLRRLAPEVNLIVV